MKTKYKQSKAEANSSQTTLQKEITTLRETNRATQLRLRDIEVSNDDFERQARNTTSSLEDLESKYNQAIERGVLAEEEIKVGEQERENLRIETQRLRDELNDLKIEADIRQEKLRSAEAAVDLYGARKPSPLVSNIGQPQSPQSELSPTTSTSSPTVATPPTKSESSNFSETQTPPSPPASDKSTSTTSVTPGPQITKTRLSIADANTTPRPSHLPSRVPRSSHRTSLLSSIDQTPSQPRPPINSRSDFSRRGPGLTSSGSLHHLHGLMNKIQNLEQRVQSARSKLPAPTSTPPRASPRSGSAMGQTYIPSTVTVRSSRKRTGGSNASFSQTPSGDRPTSRLSSAYTSSTDGPVGRTSFGYPQNSPLRESQSQRPPSREMHSSRPPSRDPLGSRPSSRASLSSRQSISHLPGSTSRPASRQSITGARTPLGHYASSTQSESRRPRSSFGGSYAGTHGHSSSVSRLGNYNGNGGGGGDIIHFHLEDDEVLTPTPSRRSTLAKDEAPAPGVPPLPLSAAANTKKRISGLGTANAANRRISSGPGTNGGDMGPPPDRKVPTRKLSGVGETY